ncbi:MAG: thioredoxin family protein [Verrucomicrobiota bacterium]|jgi:thioredoxin-related protein
MRYELDRGSNHRRNLRLQTCLALGLLMMAPKVGADEKLPMLKVGNDTYSNVTVTVVTPTDICFTYSGGMANAKLKQLDPELQKYFHYNATNALAVEKNQMAANAQYHDYLVSHPAPPPPNEDRPAPQPAAARAPDGLWSASLADALNQARSENKLVLLDFTGSDWCPWCIKFDHDVLSTDQFASYAKAKLILVKVDFLRHTPQSSDVKQANDALARQFGVDGFPTYVLLNADGKELGRQDGYLGGGPNAFIAKLENFSKS